MPDSFVLRGSATQIEIASFTRPEGIDFGTRDLFRALYAESPPDNVALQLETSGVRRMSFPLLLRASAAIPNLGLYDQEALLRKVARPGAFIDLQPHGATTAVRFDVLRGQLDLEYNSFHRRENVGLATLRLDVRPFGYWPTYITLASVASMSMISGLPLAGSVIGDWPALARISVQPTAASSVASGAWMTDFLALSLHHRASHLSFLHPASMALLAGASLLNNGVFPASQAVRYAATQSPGWFQLTTYDIATALEPSYRGRYRMFGFFDLGPSQALPWKISADTTARGNPSAALASYAPIASVAPAVATGDPGIYGAQPSPAMQLLDLGDLTIPAVGSGMGGAQRIRIWAAGPSSGGSVGVASPVLMVGGLYLLPLDSDFAGVMTRGLAAPTTLTASAGRLVLDAAANQAVVGDPAVDLASTMPLQTAWPHYRGTLPRVASAVRLELLGGVRKTAASGATGPVAQTAPTWAAVSVQYQPRFQFLKGI